MPLRRLHSGNRAAAGACPCRVRAPAAAAPPPPRSSARSIARAAPGSGDASGSDADEPPIVMGDWREFRAKLLAQSGESEWSSRRSDENMRVLRDQNPGLAAEEVWAHATPAPERGGLLISAPDATRLLESERYWQLVVLVISHDAGGTVGLILNRPSGLVMGRKQGGLPFSMAGGPPGLQEVFADSRVYCGGFLAQQVIHVLHGHKLAGSMEVVPGVYVGGENEAVARVAGGKLPASDFKFFSGALAWEPKELEAQMERGAWITAAASRPLVLKQVLQLPKPLWCEVMELMGGTFAAQARAARQQQGEGESEQ
ncbi:transcriptional regulator [Raphidocelis subcapitata]|uniref:Transcriptional regulator n=1 Tax=Raphidocelis subcapitata TaxID=307507 RepID=A0A2V0NRH1_9CHLO|nr:transcriptional regulator [Raphidocelis subcapitata]|eukprot:GBF90268.1 transcriptional regulator [Raphidocelis subcapitata]